MLITGCVLYLTGFAAYVFCNALPRRKIRRVTKEKIKEGLKLELGRTIVNLRIGKIQDSVGLDKDTAVILPVNTSFIDDCIRDEKSATGAYILNYYPDRISELPRIMIEQLEKYGYKRKDDGTYEPGTTILLPPPYNAPAKVLMTASTLRKEKLGIRAEPSIICECIRKIFEFTSDKKISKFRMPVLGSGHGGLDINEALFLLMLTIKYYSERVYHHVKQIDILIRDEDSTRIKDIYMQYFTLLREESK
jgi:hypothetical protein